MVDFDWKTKMITCNSPTKSSPRLSSKLSLPPPPPLSPDLSPAPESACSAYDHYLRLPELKRLLSQRQFPNWETESLLRPALQALELTFRFISTVLSDPRPYNNRLEWSRCLETLATRQIELIAVICEEDTHGGVPIVGLDSSDGVVPRTDSSTEVWIISGGDSGSVAAVSKGSEASLLPRLATWHKSEDLAVKIQYAIECNMRKCKYTLGLGEPNLGAKPNLDYDRICNPIELHCLKRSPISLNNFENIILYSTHQIFETWVYFSQQLLDRIGSRIGLKEFGKASSDCWVLERTWKLLEDIEDLHLLMDPDDFLHLKSQLSISASIPEAFCFRSRGLVDITIRSKDLRHRVPEILGAEVDPKGGPRIQESAMKLYIKKNEPEKIHLLQAMQGVESSVKRFYYAYKQMLVSVMGSVGANGDSLGHVFMEPTYFPSLDAAKAFLGDYWSRDDGHSSRERQV